MNAPSRCLGRPCRDGPVAHRAEVRLRFHRRWPLRLLGLVVFVLVAWTPFGLLPSQKKELPQVSLDPEIEQVARYLSWRAPISIDPQLRRHVATAVVEESRRAGFDPLYILAVMEVESEFLPEAVSSANAKGLLQLRAVTIREIASREELPEKSAFEPESVVNLRLGIRYLALMEKRFRNRDRALAAWNAGPSAVKKALAETGEVPERWLRFARAVNREHRRLRQRMAEDRPTLAVASPGARASASE